ncbi:hypothetical protein TD95_000912 [Thielaviopsis punctulata]|uniref:Uncharacterized protein n=1 Tax=Thielaviopsis punctulata TaxID=72032 RepID=A0A0F4ZFF9_9PEZI|nr:hypothetical protein TD95_000912 [Thielaviopsis punctulata]
MALSQPLKWWRPFRLMSAAQVEGLVGDKIVLPPSALEEILNAGSASAAPARPGTQPFIPYLLMFRITNPNTGKFVYAGVRDFTAEEGYAGLSPYLVSALGIVLPDGPSDVTANKPSSAVDYQETQALGEAYGSQVTIRLELAPNGDFVRFRALSPYPEIKDWRPLLEHHFRAAYTTLTKDSVVRFQHNGKDYSLVVDKISPDTHGAICIIDTNINIEIDFLDGKGGNESVSVSQEFPIRPSYSQNIKISEPVRGSVDPGDILEYKISSWDRSQALEIELSDLEDDVSLDLLVSPISRLHRTSPMINDFMFGLFDMTGPNSKTLTIPSVHPDLHDAEALKIGVYGYPGEGASTEASSFSLCVRSVPDTSCLENTVHTIDHAPGEVQCLNCRSWVSESTMMLHQNFCLRNNTTCPLCFQVFLKSSQECANHWHCPYDSHHGSSEASKIKHDLMYHEKAKCGQCDAECDSLVMLAGHSKTVCPKRCIVCQFCHLEVEQGGDPANPTPELIISGLTAHEYLDGARTTECHKCDRIVRLRDMSMHMLAHDRTRLSRQPPPLCRNAVCGRTRFGVGSQGVVNNSAGDAVVDRLGLCEVCFEPLFSAFYDPDGKAMRRRVERRYLKQLMGGCGRAGCDNEWCRTGRKTLGLEERGVRAAEAIKMVKPLLDEVSIDGAPMFFCVEELNAARRKLAEQIANEGAYELHWCIAAVEASNCDLDKAKSWLVDWAPGIKRG